MCCVCVAFVLRVSYVFPVLRWCDVFSALQERLMAALMTAPSPGTVEDVIEDDDVEEIGAPSRHIGFCCWC